MIFLNNNSIEIKTFNSMKEYKRTEELKKTLRPTVFNVYIYVYAASPFQKIMHIKTLEVKLIMILKVQIRIK